MLRLATSLAIRLQSRMIIGLIGPSSSTDGTSIRRRSNSFQAAPNGDWVWVSVGTEGEAAIVESVIRRLYGGPDQSMDECAVDLARAWIVDQTFGKVQDPILLVNGQRVIRVGPQGEVVEPEDGIAAIGFSSSLVMGAAKALRAHSEFDGERIVRESLILAADGRVVTPSSLIVATFPRHEEN